MIPPTLDLPVITFFLGWRQVYKSTADYPSASPGMNIRQCLPVFCVMYDYGLKEKKIVGGTHALQKRLPYPDCQVNCKLLYMRLISPLDTHEHLSHCEGSQDYFYSYLLRLCHTTIRKGLDTIFIERLLHLLFCRDTSGRGGRQCSDRSRLLNILCVDMMHLNVIVLNMIDLSNKLCPY